MTPTTILGTDEAIVRTPEQLAALEELFAKIGEISTLPVVALRVIQIVNDEKSNVSDLLQAVESDPALAVRILRLVNSGLHSIRQQVNDLRTAITLLGYNQIRTMALTAYISKMFQTQGNHANYSREGLWKHSVSVAQISRMIARVCGKANPDQAYVAGLLHDVGIILIDQKIRKHFVKVIDNISPELMTIDAERELLGFDHTELGEYATRKWNFPEPIVAAAGYHHQPQKYTGAHRNIVHIVALANFICTRAGVSSLGVQNVAPPPDISYSSLSMDQELLDLIMGSLAPTLEQAEVAAEV